MVDEFRQLNRVSVAFARRHAGGRDRAHGAHLRREHALLARSRSEALTDALTGLGNRRSLMEDLEDALAVADGRAR